MGTKILIFGDSHTKSLKLALEDDNYCDESPIEIRWIKVEKKGKTTGNLSLEDFQKKASQLNSNDMVVISILGTGHNILGLVRHSMPYTLFSRQSQILPDNEALVLPYAAMKQIFKEQMKKNKTISSIRKAVKCRLYHLATPPPKECNGFIADQTSKYRNNIVTEQTLNAPLTRLNIWRAEMEALEELCEEWGVTFVNPPTETITDKGFLRQEFYNKDATHANHLYGHRVISKIRGLR